MHRVTVSTVLALVLVGIFATATWVAAEEQLGGEVDIDPTSALYGRHWSQETPAIVCSILV